MKFYVNELPKSEADCPFSYDPFYNPIFGEIFYKCQCSKQESVCTLKSNSGCEYLKILDKSDEVEII